MFICTSSVTLLTDYHIYKQAEAGLLSFFFVFVFVGKVTQSNEDTDIDSMITTFNTAVTETVSEVLGKHHQKKKPSITAEILDLCDKRRELRKKRFEPEGSEKYKEVNNNIKRCIKKAKENWRKT